MFDQPTRQFVAHGNRGSTTDTTIRVRLKLFTKSQPCLAKNFLLDTNFWPRIFTNFLSKRKIARHIHRGMDSPYVRNPFLRASDRLLC